MDTDLREGHDLELRSVQIAGKYTFLSQENFGEYLLAAGIGRIKQKLIADERPDMIVEVDGDRYTVTATSSLKTIKISFTLGQVYEADVGFDRMTKYITVKADDALVTREVDNPDSVTIMKFDNDGFVSTMTMNGVTAIRVFGRV